MNFYIFRLETFILLGLEYYHEYVSINVKSKCYYIYFHFQVTGGRNRYIQCFLSKTTMWEHAVIFPKLYSWAFAWRGHTPHSSAMRRLWTRSPPLWKFWWSQIQGNIWGRGHFKMSVSLLQMQHGRLGQCTSSGQAKYQTKKKAWFFSGRFRYGG